MQLLFFIIMLFIPDGTLCDTLDEDLKDFESEDEQQLYMILIQYGGLFGGEWANLSFNEILDQFSIETHTSVLRYMIEKESTSPLPSWTITRLSCLKTPELRPLVLSLLEHAMNYSKNSSRAEALFSMEALGEKDFMRPFILSILEEESAVEVISRAAETALLHFSTDIEVIDAMREAIDRIEEEHHEFIEWREHYPNDLPWFQENYDYSDEEFLVSFNLFTDGYLGIRNFIKNYVDTGKPWPYTAERLEEQRQEAQRAYQQREQERKEREEYEQSFGYRTGQFFDLQILGRHLNPDGTPEEQRETRNFYLIRIAIGLTALLVIIVYLRRRKKKKTEKGTKSDA
ncbi:MAG: hypothetical protein NUW00_00075, partial [Candidatus Kaiserbacteria bacterium]|nr:hypothetical protein [Candidatus Kaiserbacteria bacterium]